MTTEETTVVKKDLIESTVTKEFDFDLTEADKDLKIAELGFHQAEQLKEEADFEEKKQAHKTAMLKHTNNFQRALSVLKARKETRAVQCTMVKAFNEGTVRFFFEGKLMEERPMTAEERQLEMGPMLVKGRTHERDTVSTSESHHAAPGHPDRPEIEQAIREETNPRTKHSSVDGPIE